MLSTYRCGHDSRHPSSFDMLHQYGFPHYLLLLVKSSAYFEIDGQTISTAPNMAILFDKNTRIHYGCLDSHYNDDWIHFDRSSEDTLFSQLSIPFNRPIYLPYLSHLSNYVRLLVLEEHMGALHREEIQDSILSALLRSLDSQKLVQTELTGSKRHYSAMSRLRSEIHNQPGKDWNLDALAQSVNMSVSYFQALYKEMFGLPFRRDIIQARLQQSKFYLTESNMSVFTIADFCGYKDELHFMKQFKKFLGMTPTQYRVSSRNL